MFIVTANKVNCGLSTSHGKYGLTFYIGRCLVILDLVTGLGLGVVPQDLVDGVHGGQLGHGGHLRGAGHHSGGIRVVFILSSLSDVSRATNVLLSPLSE